MAAEKVKCMKNVLKNLPDGPGHREASRHCSHQCSMQLQPEAIEFGTFLKAYIAAE
jgi:hypothetical protein